MDHDSLIPTLTRQALREPVQCLSGSESAEVISWELVTLRPPTRGMHGGVYRIDGIAQVGASVQPWSLVLKILCPPTHTNNQRELHTFDPATDPTSLLYWKREALLVQSGLLADLPVAIATPRCYGVDQVSADEVRLWFECVLDQAASGWHSAHYFQAAEALGMFGSTFLDGRPVPSASWLASDFLRRFAIRATPAVERLPALRQHRVIGRMFPSSVAAGIARIWERRDELLNALDLLPQTLCHFDAYRDNLLLRSTTNGDQFVLIDWAIAGVGPVGADGALLLGVATQREFFESDARKDLDVSIFSHYLNGLRRSGWEGDERLVRFGSTATMALKVLIGYLPDELSTWLDESWYAAFEEQTGSSIEDFAERVADSVAWLVERGDEALALLPEVRALCSA